MGLAAGVCPSLQRQGNLIGLSGALCPGLKIPQTFFLPLCPSFLFCEIGRIVVSLPWTIWGCLLCWMDHNGDCFSQTVCGLGMPPSQSEIKAESPIICLSSQLHGQALVQVQLSFPTLHILTPSVSLLSH